MKKEKDFNWKKCLWLLYGIGVLAALCIIGSSFLKEKFHAEETVNEQFQEESETRTIGSAYHLNRGVYRVTIDYKAETTNHYIFADSLSESSKIGCDRLILERAKEQESFLVWVSGEVEDFQVMCEYKGAGELFIIHVSIYETRFGKLHDLFYGVLFVIVLFGILNLMRTKAYFHKKQLVIIVCLAIITILSSVPLFVKGIYIGHDSGFHLNRIEGVWQGLASGQFPVRIQPNWLHGYGYGVSVCYGDIFLYIPAVLRLLGFSVQEAYEWFVFLINGITAIVSYFCWKKMTGDDKAALAGSFLYTLSVYRMVNLYVRAAVGEYCAMIFLPVILYGFWNILVKEEQGRKNWIPLTIGFSGLLQTHILSCEMVGIVAILICLLYIKRVFKKENLIAFGKAIAGTVLINAWFLVPFLNYMLREHLKINTETFSGRAIQNTGASLKQLFGIFMPGMGSGGTGGTMPKGIGLGLWLAVLFCGMTWLKYRRKMRETETFGYQLFLAGIALICATKYFPWDFLIQLGLSFFASLQFPWRFLGIAIAFLCGAISCCAHMLSKVQKKRELNVCLAIIIGAASLSSGYTMLTFMENGDLTSCYEQRDAPYYVSGGEYLPSDIEFSENAFHPLEPLASNMEISRYEKKYNRVVVDCKNLLEEENILQVPILLYYGYQAYDIRTKERFPMLRTELGMTGIGLPANYQGTIHMKFQEPVLWTMANLISAAVLLFFVAWQIWQKYMKKVGRKEKLPGI